MQFVVDTCPPILDLLTWCDPSSLPLSLQTYVSANAQENSTRVSSMLVYFLFLSAKTQDKSACKTNSMFRILCLFLSHQDICFQVSVNRYWTATSFVLRLNPHTDPPQTQKKADFCFWGVKLLPLSFLTVCCRSRPLSSPTPLFPKKIGNCLKRGEPGANPANPAELKKERNQYRGKPPPPKKTT